MELWRHKQAQAAARAAKMWPGNPEIGIDLLLLHKILLLFVPKNR